MSSSSYQTPNKKLPPRNNASCGDVTFLMQAQRRVYALNCCFCNQISLQWDSFIDHMEQDHDEDLDFDQKGFSESLKKVEQHSASKVKSKKSMKPVYVYEEDENNADLHSDPLTDGSNYAECSKFEGAIELMDQYEGTSIIIETQDPSYDDEVDFTSQSKISNQANKTATKSDVKALMNKLDYSQKLISQLMDEVKMLRGQAMSAKKLLTSNGKLPAVLPNAPFTEKEDFFRFEKKIQSSDEQFMDFVAELKEGVSGNSAKFIKSCWRRIMIDDLAQNFCWQGSSVKSALKNLSTTIAIKRAYTEKYADHSDAEFEKCTIGLFQQAKGRISKKFKFKHMS